MDLEQILFLYFFWRPERAQPPRGRMLGFKRKLKWIAGKYGVC